jgi:hypothetical protein
MRKSVISIIMLMIILVTFMSCDKNPVALTVEKVQGNWAGNGDQSAFIFFIVRESYIDYFSFKFEYHGVFMEFRDGDPNVKIGNDMKFNIVMYASEKTLTVNGEFKSNNKCEGSFQFDDTSGRWQADQD